MPARDTPPPVRTARLILVSFLFTFLAARILVFLIMSRRLPDLYLHLGGTHVHHLNYGIFLLSAVGALLLLTQPHGPSLTSLTLLYGVGLALTFDEFGMWLHLGGPYWQRASFDAITVIAALFGLIAVAPALRRFRPRHYLTAALLALTLLLFTGLLIKSFHYASHRLAPYLHETERTAPQ